MAGSLGVGGEAAEQVPPLQCRASFGVCLHITAKVNLPGGFKHFEQADIESSGGFLLPNPRRSQKLAALANPENSRPRRKSIKPKTLVRYSIYV
jgi:hypothetical protein